MKKMEFDIEPTQGAAAIFAMCSLKGYQLVKLERNKRKVTCWYQKI